MSPATGPALGAGAVVGTGPGAPSDLGPGTPAPSGTTASPDHLPGADVPFVPPATGGRGAPHTGTSAVGHPEYLIDADPWRDPAADPDERRLVTPPVLGEHDDR